jgi:hypothetical protein
VKTKAEATARLPIHDLTLVHWAQYGVIERHSYNAHAYLYELPDSHLPVKYCSRWDTLVNRVAALKMANESKPKRLISCAVAPSSAHKSTQISRNADSCWSTRTTDLLPTRLRPNASTHKPLYLIQDGLNLELNSWPLGALFLLLGNLKTTKVH